MTSAPPQGFFTRYLLENPWPAVVMLALIALALARFGRDRDDRRLLLGALGCAVAGAAVFLVSWLVTTPAEHARRVTSEIVAAAEAGNLNAMRALFAPDASIHPGSLSTPGLERAEIDRGIDALGDRHRIESNTVTALRAGTVDADTAVAELGCLTTTASSYGTVPSTWLFRVERGADGRWRVRRLACVAIAGRAPSGLPW